MGIRTPLQPYISTALGASEVRLLELAGAYRAMASGILAEPHVIARVTDASGGVVLYEAPRTATDIGSDGPSFAELSLIQEGLRGVVRLPEGTAHALDGRRLPDPGDGQDRNDERLPRRAVRRIDLRAGGDHGGGPDRLRRQPRARREGNRLAATALPIFREIMLRLYQDELVGPVPLFPCDIEERIDDYLALRIAGKAAPEERPPDVVAQVR